MIIYGATLISELTNRALVVKWSKSIKVRRLFESELDIYHGKVWPSSSIQRRAAEEGLHKVEDLVDFVLSRDKVWRHRRRWVLHGGNRMNDFTGFVERDRSCW